MSPAAHFMAADTCARRHGHLPCWRIQRGSASSNQEAKALTTDVWSRSAKARSS